MRECPIDFYFLSYVN